MPERRPALQTPSDALSVAEAMSVAWWRLWDEVPERWSILVLLAQSALETAEWKKMICYSLGGVKSRDGDGHDFTYFATSECLSKAAAESRVKAAGRRSDAAGRDVVIVGQCSDGKTKVKLYPDNPGCRFRAFDSLEHSAIDHLGMLKSHKAFSQAWPAVVAGSPESYATLLKAARYYTAPVEQYASQIKLYFKRYSSLPFTPAAAVQQAQERQGQLSQSDKDRAAAAVALSMQQMIDAMASGGWK